MHCKQCNTTKLDSEFYACNRTRCKECIKAGVNAYRQENLEKVRSYDRLRGSMPHRVAARAEYAQTPAGREAHRRANRAYSATDAAKHARKAYRHSEGGKAKRAEVMKRQALKYPERHKARTALGNAVRDGKVIPWPVCAIPECCGKPHGHHPDYSRPLDVVWLCDKHHKQAHALVANEPGYRREA